jgi:hypothetical protein
MIERGFANYNERTGKWEWGEQASRRHAFGKALAK